MEKKKMKADNMDNIAILETISRLYYAVYVIDIENDAYYAVRAAQGAEEVICGCHSFTEACRKYVDTCVFPDDGAKVRRFASTGYMASVLTPASPTCRVELRRGRHPKYEWIAIIFMATEFADGKATRAVVAAENIDGQKNSTFLGEQTRMQNYARKLAADADRRIRSVTEKSADERSAILLKMNARGRLLYLALQKTSTQTFEYDIASNRLTTILEWSDTGESVTYEGGSELISDYNSCSDRDALAIENAFNTAISGQDAEAEYASNLQEERQWKRMKLYVMRVDGKPTGTIVGVISDITRERAIAQHAREEQEFRRAVLGSSAYGMEISLRENTWRYLWRNNTAKLSAQTGDYDRDLLSAPLMSIVAKEDYSAYFAAMNRESLLEAWDGGKTEVSVDYRAKNDDGEYVWFRNVIHLVEDDDGGVKASVYVSDINAQKLREIAAEAHKRELEETARAEKRANELKSSFLTNMSHELRTPLNAILGMSQLSLREEMSNEARSFIHGIRSAGTGLLGVVNGILDLAKIETGKLEISEGEYKPMELMNGLASMFEYQANDKSLAFSIVMEPGLPTGLVGDEGHLRQVFINLINNALKYTESGGVTVSLGQKPGESGKIILTACVRDTGVGIRRERLPLIFNEFDRDNEDPEAASGVGLSISRRMVRLMGGELTAKSEYGSGSEFCFEVPQGVFDSTPGGEFARTADRRAEDGAFWNFCAPDATVMMVDDNPVNLRVGIGLLRPFGMRIITAGGGAEALEMLKKEKVDLILMDHMMPEMDGLETTKRIRSMGGAFKRLPILALTANAMKGVKEMLLTNGMDDYMSKPVEMWELSEKLRRWLPEKKVAMQASADVPVTLEWPVNLPDIPGVDVAKGLSYTCTFDDYMTCLRDFWSIIPEKSASMERLAEAGEVLNYTAEAHSLKSSARLIGADGLSDMAAKLEKYGHEERLEDIRLENPRLMALYRSYSAKLEPFVKTDTDTGTKKLISARQFAKKLRELAGFVKEFDCDSADHWSDDMRALRVPEEFEPALEKLHMYILAAKFSSCAQLVNELLEKLK